MYIIFTVLFLVVAIIVVCVVVVVKNKSMLMGFESVVIISDVHTNYTLRSLLLRVLVLFFYTRRNITHGVPVPHSV